MSFWEFRKTKLSSIPNILMQSGCFQLKSDSLFLLVGLPDDEEEKAEGFIGEVGGGFFLVRLMTRRRRPRALRRSSIEENIFLIICHNLLI